jgi:hypothetical protein
MPQPTSRTDLNGDRKETREAAPDDGRLPSLPVPVGSFKALNISVENFLSRHRFLPRINYPRKTHLKMYRAGLSFFFLDIMRDFLIEIEKNSDSGVLSFFLDYQNFYFNKPL